MSDHRYVAIGCNYYTIGLTKEDVALRHYSHSGVTAEGTRMFKVEGDFNISMLDGSLSTENKPEEIEVTEADLADFAGDALLSVGLILENIQQHIPFEALEPVLDKLREAEHALEDCIAEYEYKS